VKANYYIVSDTK